MSDVIQVNPLVFGGNGGVEIPFMTKLWENPAPTASFAAQTITLASDDYDFYLIVAKWNTGVDRQLSVIAQKGSGSVLNYITGNVVRSRSVIWVSNTELSVQNGTTSTGGGSAADDNTIIIPVAIYGFKKSYNIEDVAIANVSTSATQCIMSDNVTTVEDVLNRLQHINLSSYTNITSVLPYTVVDDVAQIKITASTGSVQYGGVDVTINGLTVFAMGKLTAGTEDFSQQIAFRVYKGDVISGNINPAGGSLRVDLAKHT